MAWFAAVAGAVGSGVGAAGQMQGGREGEAIANKEALQYEARATLTRAIGSRQAERIRRATERVAARARAVMAASGLSASDVTASEVDDAIVREGSVNELLAVAQAEDEAKNDDFRARLRRAGGEGERAASTWAAGRTLIEGFSSWRDRFGSGANGTNGARSGNNGGAYGGSQPPPFEGDWAPQTGY